MDLLEFGFPLDFDRSSDVVSSEVNHASLVNFRTMLMNTSRKNCHMGLC